MTGVTHWIRHLTVGLMPADRIVPPTGYTARLTIFASGVMAFLAVFALALSFATGRLAERWSNELAQVATLQIIATGEEREFQTDIALTILKDTPGVADVRALSPDEQSALLAPWFGGTLPEGDLPIPQLIEIVSDTPAFDADALRQRLAAEIPGAVLQDHARWRRPLVEAAQGLRRLGWLSVLLIAGGMAAMIALSAQAALSANSEVVRVLRLVGARDSFIAGAFMRRFTVRAFVGGFIGSLVAALALALLPTASEAGGFLTGLGFQGAGWLWPAMVPIVGAALALAATWAAARRMLKRLS
jgi:cell division transport system permease protein